jgi:hypothetical protein
MKDRVDVVCPCCSTKLTVETASGEILAEERPKHSVEKTFEGAMGQVRTGAKRREDAFSKALDRTQRMEDILTKKFEEAKKKADSEPDSKPPSPFDAD